MLGRVLVVDDNRALAENLGELLGDEGLTVDVCIFGGDALSRARAQNFDVAVVDVGLPDVLGVDLVADLRAQMAEGEVILMTGDASLDTAIAAVQRGVFAYVQKPFAPADLLALIERALGQVQLRRERRALQHELAASERLYRGIVESVDSLIVGVRGDGAVYTWNRRAAEVTGYQQEEVLGRDFIELCVAPEHRARCYHLLAEAGAGRLAAEAECGVVPRSGPSRVVRWQIRPLLPSEEREEVLLLVGTDVTERLALERRAADAEAMASLATLTTGLAHEIRNPLNAALLQIELLSRLAGRIEGASATRVVECARLVQAEIQRLSRLLEEFLSLARPRSLARAPVDVGALCQAVVSMQRLVAEQAGVQLTLAVAPKLRRVMGDQPRLTQVLINLVVNAIDAMRDRPGGEIVISAEPWDDRRKVRLCVADQGPGVPAEVAGKIFTPFVSTKERGTGLGLAIVKRIVDLHGGSVALLPRPGGGTIAEVIVDAG